MPVKYITSQIKWPQWAGARYQKLDILQRFLEGTIYDHLNYSFYEETTAGTSYIPLRDRRPSVIYNIPRIIVSRSSTLLFGDKHFPKFHTSSQEITDFLLQLDNSSALQPTMLEAARVGALGSVCVLFSIIEGKFFYEVWNPKLCMPIFSPQRDLVEVLIMSPTIGYDLKAMGYSIDPEFLNSLHFYAKRVTTEEEILYYPILCEEYEDESSLVKDDERSSSHSFGFVPGVWIRNFPQASGVDAPCSFQDILNICVELDYQLSQCGRGLKYNSDPQLLIKEPSGSPNAASPGYDPNSVRSTSTAIIVGEEGDAKLLEISGQGQKIVIEFVKQLRQYALEVARGSRKEPDKAYGNMSGRAMEILESDLLGLVAEHRLAYGEQGLKLLLMKVLRASYQEGLLSTNIEKIDDFAIRLVWGNWFDPTPTDLYQTEQALNLAVRGRRLYQSEARMLAQSLWGLGQAKQDDLEEEYPIPPEPEIVKDDKEMKTLSPPSLGGTSGDDGRDSKILA